MGEWLDALLRSDLFTFFQLQGCLVFALLSLGWAWAGIRRGQELQRMLAAGQLRRSEDEVPPPAGTGGPLPAITVVMPVKGCRAHSASNWRSHLNLQYDGPRQLLFVVESDADAAYQPLQALIKQLPQRDAAVLVAGCSTSCSQKLHNMAAGVAAAAPASKYVLFLDDDVDLHDSAAQALVQVLERDPRLFMATGYPMDVPPRGASLAAYCMLAYHLPLVVAFSLGDTAQFVWGGCMLLPLDALRDDRYGIMRGWSQGGYSDDLILAAACTQHRLPIATPPFAIFPQWLDARCSWRQYWNYLRRQLFVLDTYTSSHNRRVNYTMTAVATWAAWAFDMMALTVCCRLATAALRLGAWAAGTQPLVPHWAGTAPGDAVSSQPGLRGVADSSGGWLPCSSARLNAASALLLLPLFCLAQGCVYFMVHRMCALLRALSPKRMPVWAGQFNFLKLWAAMAIQSLVLPLCVAYTFAWPHVRWSGVMYYKQAGRIVRVVREAAGVAAGKLG